MGAAPYKEKDLKLVSFQISIQILTVYFGSSLQSLHFLLIIIHYAYYFPTSKQRHVLIVTRKNITLPLFKSGKRDRTLFNSVSLSGFINLLQKSIYEAARREAFLKITFSVQNLYRRYLKAFFQALLGSHRSI